jgi:hypothetical protein
VIFRNVLSLPENETNLKTLFGSKNTLESLKAQFKNHHIWHREDLFIGKQDYIVASKWIEGVTQEEYTQSEYHYIHGKSTSFRRTDLPESLQKLPIDDTFAMRISHEGMSSQLHVDTKRVFSFQTKGQKKIIFFPPKPVIDTNCL